MISCAGTSKIVWHTYLLTKKMHIYMSMKQRPEAQRNREEMENKSNLPEIM